MLDQRYVTLVITIICFGIFFAISSKHAGDLIVGQYEEIKSLRRRLDYKESKIAKLELQLMACCNQKGEQAQSFCTNAR